MYMAGFLEVMGIHHSPGLGTPLEFKVSDGWKLTTYSQTRVHCGLGSLPLLWEAQGVVKVQGWSPVNSAG